MKYIIRALKYFVYLGIIMTVLILALSLSGLVGDSIDEIFKEGVHSLWKILGILAVFSAVYPAFGYGTRRLMVPGAFEEIRDNLVSVMAERGYELEKEDGENLSFRKRGWAQKLLGMFEDRLSFSRCLGGFDVEGRSKDVLRAISAIEYRFKGE